LTSKPIVAVWVSPPPLADTVTFVVPVVAVLLAVKVRVELPVPGAASEVGLKAAVTPEGNAEVASEIAALKPPLTEVAIMLLPELPCVTDTLVGEALKLNAGVEVAVTVRGIVKVCVIPPPLPLTVTLVVPAVAVPLAAKVKEEPPLPGAPMELGLKPAVTPVGRPETESEMEELNPPDTAVETVVPPEPPWVTDELVGAALKVKSGVELPGLKMISRTECNSIWLGAAPVCPCGKSCMPTPVTRTGTFMD